MMALSKKIVGTPRLALFYLTSFDISKGVIHSIHFHRLILDEAHNIKVYPITALWIGLDC